jgi:hypothetical protein
VNFEIYIRFAMYFLLILYGIMCANTCSHGVVVDFKVFVIIRSVVFNSASILFTCVLFFQKRQQYSALEYTKSSPQLVPASLCIMLFLLFSF